MTQQEARAAFPALASGFAFLENAGGSQLPEPVIEAVRRYLGESFVQVGAPYRVSKKATETVAEARRVAREILGAGDEGRILLGPSTSALCRNLADAYGLALNPGDEVVVSEAGHESNVGPWMRLERRGITVRRWKPDGEDATCTVEGLRPLLGDRTKLVVFAQTSNLLGDIVDIAALTSLTHEAGARVVVDGVAYAPHNPVDVLAWGVDYYVYSAYKVYAPHMAAMFARADALDEVPEGPNHFFLQNDPVYRFELGSVSHEAAAGLCGLRDYLDLFGGARAAFAQFQEWERPLMGRLGAYLGGDRGWRLFGPQDGRRVPTFGFTFTDPSRRTVEEHERVCALADEAGIGIRYGHMYSYRLCEHLGLEPAAGVLRASLVHYNTSDEVARLIDVLEKAL